MGKRSEYYNPYEPGKDYTGANTNMDTGSPSHGYLPDTDGHGYLPAGRQAADTNSRHGTAGAPQKKQGSPVTALPRLILAVVTTLAPIASAYFLLKGCYDEQVQEELQSKLELVSNHIVFADNFQMTCVANPTIKGSYASGIKANVESYTRVEYRMELPSANDCEPGVVYFAPDYSGKTQACIDNYNIRMVRFADETEPQHTFPVTYDSLINERNVIGFYCKNSFIKGSDYLDFREPVWNCLRDGLYAKIFLLQAKGQPLVRADGSEIMVDADGYLDDMNSAFGIMAADKQTAQAIDLVFSNAPPADMDLEDGKLYLYPHRQGHTDTLIDNLNQIVAESPELLELLEDSGLSAPLTLDNILNDRETVWKIINHMDSEQITRFRSR